MPPLILLMHNNPEIRDQIRDCLLEQGYEVREALDGRAGLAMIGESRPDLLVLGLKLPAMSGYLVCKHLRAHPDYQNLPIIVISAIGEHSDHPPEFWREGLHVDEFIPLSSFDLENFLGEVQYIFRRPDYRHERKGEIQPDTAPRDLPLAKPAPHPSEGSPEDVVRAFIESWNEGDFAREYACLAESMTSGLLESAYIQRRTHAFKNSNKKIESQYLAEVLDSTENGKTAQLTVRREERHGKRGVSRTEIYRLEHTEAGWKIIGVKPTGES